MKHADLVVIGLGYAGLPLAQEAVRSGLAVTGYDHDPAVVQGLNSGRSRIGDISDADVAVMLAGGFSATADKAALPLPGTVVICVPTPLSPRGGPDLTAVLDAAETAAGLLRPGMLVVLESTSYPGTTGEIVRPVLEQRSGLAAGTDFHLAFSPERTDPGNRAYGVRNTPKIAGGYTRACTTAAAGFYGKICDQVVEASSSREAEMAKLIENTYRAVNIALVNEMAVLCREMGIDIWDAIRCAATKPFGFQAFYPGPGPGGHCIPVDPEYLAYKAASLGCPFRFAELAQEINGQMPGYVADRAAELLESRSKAVRGARVLLAGVTYKKDVADQRGTPAIAVARRLRAQGAVLSYHDPYVDRWEVDGQPVRREDGLDAGLAAADLVILLQLHSAYKAGTMAEMAPLLLDATGQARGENTESL